MNNEQIYDLIIIGGGPVGLYSAFIAGYLKLKTLCIEADDFLGGQPYKVYPNKLIHDFPGYSEIKARDLIDNLVKQIKQFPNYSEIKTKVKIMSYETLEDGTICLVDSELNKYLTKHVLLTVGIGAFEPMKLEDFSKSHNHHKVRYNLEDDETYNDKNVLVLGGGDAAVDYAYHIKTHSNANVTIAHRRDVFRANGLGIEDLQNQNINVILNATLTQWHEDYCEFNTPEFENLQVPYDILLIQYGLKNLGSIVHTWQDFQKDKNKFIVNEMYETNVPNFFAAGNCIHDENRINMIITGISEATIVLN